MMRMRTTITALLAATALISGTGTAAQAASGPQKYDVQVSAGHFKATVKYNGTAGHVVYLKELRISIPAGAPKSYQVYFQVYKNSTQKWQTVIAWNGTPGNHDYLPAGSSDVPYYCEGDPSGGSVCPVLNTRTDDYKGITEGTSRLLVQNAGGSTSKGIVYRPLFAPSS